MKRKNDENTSDNRKQKIEDSNIIPVQSPAMPSMQDFYNAVIYQGPQEIQALLQQGMDINVQDTRGDTALHHAIFNSKLENAIFLIEQGADINITSNSNDTPLYYVLLKVNHLIDQNIGYTQQITNYIEFTEYLLSIPNIEIHHTGHENSNALHLAAEGGLTSVIARLLALGAPINADDPQTGQTALHFAASSGQVEALEYILTNNAAANINALDNEGITPLMTAAYMDEWGAVKCLINLGANINLKGDDNIHLLELLSYQESHESEDFEGSEEMQNALQDSEEIKLEIINIIKTKALPVFGVKNDMQSTTAGILNFHFDTESDDENLDSKLYDEDSGIEDDYKSNLSGDDGSDSESDSSH